VSPRIEAWWVSQWQTRGVAFWLLWPLAATFAVLAGARSLAYRCGWLRAHDVGRAVLVVGNITVGGTGKTPLTIAIARGLTKRGVPCGIVTRGFRRDGATLATPLRADNADPSAVGDEAVLLSRATGVPVFVHADRVAAARTLVAHHPDTQIILCDDGLQHHRLRRDLELCVVDARRSFGNGARLPAGPLREDIRRLKSVDAVVVNRSGASDNRVFAGAPHETPTFDMHYAVRGLRKLDDASSLTIGQALSFWRTQRIAAMAGIGDPARFFDELKRAGFSLVQSLPMPDHHAYQLADLAAIDADIVLVTEKDAVKLAAFEDPRVWVLEIEAELPPAFDAFLAAALQRIERRHVD
jgi:tetraacyldisaccharide 4'-kinase